jgi:hypothetical protein
MTPPRPAQAGFRDVKNSDPRALVGLMSLAADGPTKYTTAELKAIWRHQLEAPLQFDLQEVSQDITTTLAEVTRADHRPLNSFGDLINHPQPPVQLLQWAKDFAKSHANGADHFPGDVASVLYYVAIALARTRLARKITELPDSELRRGVEWASKQLWLDESTRAVLSKSLADIPAK